MGSHRGPAESEAHTSSGRLRAVEKLKSVVMKCAMGSGSSPPKSQSLQRSRRALIEKRIHELVPTPQHPPYAWMIENAIKHLNGEVGLDEEAISKFILEEYKDLPWAHPAFLNHHLKRLSKTGNLTQNLRITCSPSPVSSYTPSYASSDPSSSTHSYVQERRRKKKKKKRRNCGKKSQRQKKRMNARGMSDDGEMMKQVSVGKVGGDVCLDGLREVDIQSLLTEDEDEDEDEDEANIQGQVDDLAHLHQSQQQIIVFEHQQMMKQVSVGKVGGDICLDGLRQVDIQSLLTEDEDEEEDEANVQGQVDDHAHLHQSQQQIIVFEHQHEDQQNMGDDDCSSTPTTSSKRIRNTCRSKHRTPQTRRGNRDERDMNVDMMVNDSMDTDLKRKEQQQESFQQIHYLPKPKPRPRPYRNVADIYESSPAAMRKTS